MAFMHGTQVYFPEIPELIIHDHWVGVGADEGLLILNITRGIWGAAYVIVDADDYAYSIVPDSDAPEHEEEGGEGEGGEGEGGEGEGGEGEGGEEPASSPSARDEEPSTPQYPTPHIGTLKPVKLNLGIGAVKCDSLIWKSGNTKLYNDAVKGWVLINPSWGDGNYYSFGHSSTYATATPAGKWAADPDKDPPDRIDFHYSWPRWNRPSSWGSQNVYANYSPATTYVDSQVQGTIRVGTPCWNNSGGLGMVYKTAMPDDDGNYYYVFEDGKFFRPDYATSTYIMYYDGKSYSGSTPTAGSSWTVAWTDGTDSGTVSFSWVGWVEGISEIPVPMCEIGRLF